VPACCWRAQHANGSTIATLCVPCFLGQAGSRDEMKCRIAHAMRSDRCCDRKCKVMLCMIMRSGKLAGATGPKTPPGPSSGVTPQHADLHPPEKSETSAMMIEACGMKRGGHVSDEEEAAAKCELRQAGVVTRRW